MAVAAGRGGPIKVAYEVHGNGPIHLMVSLLHTRLSVHYAISWISYKPSLFFTSKLHHLLA